MALTMKTQNLSLNILIRMKLTLMSLTPAVLAAALTLSSCKGSVDKHPTVQPPVKVAVMVVGESATNQGRVYSATVESNSTSMLSFSVPGTIESVSVAEGQRVAKGQALASIKAEDYTYADNIARAQLAEAKDAYARLKKLHDANALPDIKWVEMQQKLEQAQNAADISARALRETTLRAPFAGVISRKLADKGQNVAPIEPVFEIMVPDALSVEISVPENELSSLKVGDVANVTFNSSDIAPLKGKITRKAVSADPLTRTFKVKIDIPGAPATVLPGMLASVTFENARAEELKTITLPSQAVILNDDNRTFVWVVRNGRTERRFVASDELSSAGVVVSDGLEVGDTVVVAGMQKVGSGSIVDAQIR